MRVHMLGTGGATNECRNQASLLVEDGRGELVLLDTGSGMSVVRALMSADCDPRQVRHIFVSHRHMDHAGGLEPLLLWLLVEAGAHIDHPVSVYSDARTIDALQRMFAAIATVVPDIYGERLRWQALQPGVATRISSGMTVTAFAVDHLPEDGGAQGCLLQADGRRIAYSGDTRPSASLVAACHGVNALFHEAGGLDGDAEHVHLVGHSTAADASRAASQAGAERLILTHFPDDNLVEPMLAEATAHFPRGGVDMAFDGMVFDL